jgi:hypothetical protein
MRAFSQGGASGESVALRHLTALIAPKVLDGFPINTWQAALGGGGGRDASSPMSTTLNVALMFACSFCSGSAVRAALEATFPSEWPCDLFGRLVTACEIVHLFETVAAWQDDDDDASVVEKSAAEEVKSLVEAIYREMPMGPSAVLPNTHIRRAPCDFYKCVDVRWSYKSSAAAADVDPDHARSVAILCHGYACLLAPSARLQFLAEITAIGEADVRPSRTIRDVSDNVFDTACQEVFASFEGVQTVNQVSVYVC